MAKLPLTAILTLLCIAYTAYAESQRCLITTGVMGTELELVAWGEEPEAVYQSLRDAEKEIQRIEDLMTDWRDSPLMDLNKAAGEKPIAVERELAAIISRALEISKLTEGAFDPTFGSAGKLWKFKVKPPQIPTSNQVGKALLNVGAHKVSVNPNTLEVTLPAGMWIGLGGIAKGYAVDRAMEVLRSAGIKNAMVNAGGDMKLLGMDGDKPWEIAIKHPRDKKRAIAVLNLSNHCLVTSGDYERFFEHEGKRYHHILDPRTGFPATGCMSASVVAPNAELADALATALCVLPPETGMKLIESLDYIDCILVDLEGNVSKSSGLAD